MIHAIAYLAFIIIVSHWLRLELGRKDLSLSKYFSWIIGAVALPIFASFLDSAYGGKFGNFLLHSVGGGAASTLMFFYLIKTFEFKINWRLQLAILFTFVSALGALNELAEYAFELLGLGPFSFDTYDTWRDFVANTSGALITWLLIRSYLFFRRG
jgi:hypothetical protein